MPTTATARAARELDAYLKWRDTGATTGNAGGRWVLDPALFEEWLNSGQRDYFGVHVEADGDGDLHLVSDELDPEALQAWTKRGSEA